MGKESTITLSQQDVEDIKDMLGEILHAVKPRTLGGIRQEAKRIAERLNERQKTRQEVSD